tara:strand:+ start:12525 stop:12758 length:234 start_codon:yes stop_codon:yes gene_type:complete
MDYDINLTPFEVSALNAYSLALGIHDGFVNNNLIEISDKLLLEAEKARDDGDEEKSSYYLELRQNIFMNISGFIAEA